jgi:hypothetical protein
MLRARILLPAFLANMSTAALGESSQLDRAQKKKRAFVAV